MWFYIIIGVIFIGLGLAVHRFKWYFLIAGYNTMSTDKKAQVDVEGLARLMAQYAYVNGGFLIMMGMLHALGLNMVIIPTLIFYIISTVCLFVAVRDYDGNTP